MHHGQLQPTGSSVRGPFNNNEMMISGGHYERCLPLRPYPTGPRARRSRTGERHRFADLLGRFGVSLAIITYFPQLTLWLPMMLR